MTPFGRYLELVAFLVALGTIGAAIVAHVFRAALAVEPGDLAFLDAVALISLGAIFGARGAQMTVTNGLAAKTEAAHQRLDKMGAPPADDGPR